MLVLDKLAELQDARDRHLISSSEAARRARAILDREGMEPIDLAVFLQERGYQGIPLWSAVGSFGKAVKAAYNETYGRDPLRVDEVINGQHHFVNSYLELDRPMIEKVFEVWS
jgi:hypothetical protein